MPSIGPEIPVFDPVAIEKLRSVAGDQDPDFVAEMGVLFADETAKSLADLKSGSERSDWKLISRVAHSLKSSAATLGFMRLSAVCKALEFDTHGGSPGPETASLVALVFTEFDATETVLKTLR